MKMGNRKTMLWAAALAITLGGGTREAGATTYIWSMPCDESQVNNSGVGDGSTDSTATGQADVRYDDVSDLLSYDISWNGLEGLLTAIHIHGPASSSESVMPHLFNVYTAEADVIVAGVNRTTDQTSATDSPLNFILATGGAFEPEVAVGHLVDDMAYVNIHSDLWPAGEIRCHFVLTDTLESLTKGQQKCSATVNKGYTKVASTGGKVLSACAKGIAKGDIVDTIPGCVAADADMKLLGAVTKAADGIGKRCNGNDSDGDPLFPPFGAGSIVTITDDIGSIAPPLATTVGGSIVTQVTEESVDQDRSRCELAVVKSVTKCVDTINKAYDKCAKLGLKGKKTQSVVQIEDLDACVTGDEKGKIQKACGAVDGKVGKALDKRCADVDLPTTFGSCPVVPATVADAAVCTETAARCHTCEARKSLVGLTVDCDAFDDGAVNASCP